MKIYGNIQGGESSTGHVSNMRISYSGGTLKIVGYDGNDLSTTNPGFVSINYGTGFAKDLVFTSSPSFDDDANADSDFIVTSGVDIDFHSTHGRAWGDDAPFFLYATYDTSDNPHIFLSPNPALSSTSSGSGVVSYWKFGGSSQGKNTCFYLASSVTAANLTSRPCVRIGSIGMTKTSSDDWTVTGYNGDGWGIGRFPHTREFTLPSGQGGASVSAYTTSTGPTWSTNRVRYKINEQGYIYQTGTHVGTCTNGSGTSTTGFALPYSPALVETSVIKYGNGQIRYGGAVVPQNAPYISASNQFVQIDYQTSLTSQSDAVNNGWSGGSDNCFYTLFYPAF